MRKILESLYLLSGYVAAGLIAAIALIVTIQVSLNITDQIAIRITGTAIGLTVPSYSDFTGFFLAAASFLALAYTLREGGLIRVNLFLQRLSYKSRRILEFWSIGLAMSVSIYFTIYSFRLVHESYSFEDVSPGIIAVPIWIPQLAMAIGLLILSIAFIDEFVQIIRGKPTSYEGKGENLLLEIIPIKSTSTKT